MRYLQAKKGFLEKENEVERKTNQKRQTNKKALIKGE